MDIPQSTKGRVFCAWIKLSSWTKATTIKLLHYYVWVIQEYEHLQWSYFQQVTFLWWNV